MLEARTLLSGEKPMFMLKLGSCFFVEPRQLLNQRKFNQSADVNINWSVHRMTCIPLMAEAEDVTVSLGYTHTSTLALAHTHALN